MLSTLHSGAANTNSNDNFGVKSSAKNKVIEYLGNGGVMELESNVPQKMIIDCLADEGRECDVYGYPVCELYAQKAPVDFFETVEQEGILRALAYRDVLVWCINVLKLSPSANVLVKEAVENDWYIDTEDLQSGDYCIDVEERTLIINNGGLSPIALSNSEHFRNIMLVNTIKALRDVWQEKRHGGFDEEYSPGHVMLLERVRSADLDIASIMVAWELRSKSSGYKKLWGHIVGSRVNDMAMAFSGYQDQGNGKELNRKGLLAAFKQWFDSEDRKKECDRDTLEYLDEVLASSDFINPFGNKRPGKINVEMLSSLPDKTAYLQGQGHEILNNPVYCEVEDAINKAHLAHIMRDTEAVVVESVAFRDADLARKIFPEGFASQN